MSEECRRVAAASRLREALKALSDAEDEIRECGMTLSYTLNGPAMYTAAMRHEYACQDHSRYHPTIHYKPPVKEYY